jgi:hypothetical protein
MKNKAYIIPVLILTLVVNGISQNYKNNWLFGDEWGLSFNNNSIEEIGSEMFTSEGCASISDDYGNLLFHSNGIEVFSFDGILMPNGTGLLGKQTSTQSSIIVPNPCSRTQYYLFTTGSLNQVSTQGTLYYNLIDMDDSGDGYFDRSSERGSVISKNINLPGPTGEKICAIRKSNGLDFWVITIKENTNSFYIYQVTSSGVSLPNIISLGPSIDPLGYIKISPDGTKLALASRNFIYLYTFNNSNGMISNQNTVDQIYSLDQFYGLEFSSNSNKLYYSKTYLNQSAFMITQADVSSPLTSPPSFTKSNIFQEQANVAYTALALSPDKQNIFFINQKGNHLASISNINLSSPIVNPNLIQADLPLRYGLPNFYVDQYYNKCIPSMDNSGQRVYSANPYNLGSPIVNLPNIFSWRVAKNMKATTDIEFDDIDNDGDIDLLYNSGLGGELYIMKNLAGYGNTPYFDIQFNTNIKANSFRLFDQDKDGWKDLVYFDGYVVWIRKNVSGTFQNPSILKDLSSFGIDKASLIEFGDINEDNKPDILIADPTSDELNVFINNISLNTIPTSNSNFGDYYSNPLICDNNNGSVQSPEFFDVGCDGKLDLFLFDPVITGASPVYNGRMDYYTNSILSNSISNNLNCVNSNINNTFGFLDNVAGQNANYTCNKIITRMVDWYGDGCPIAISYNPCKAQSGDYTQIFIYQKQHCKCR